ncbi:hypothetical protein FDECE_820 [Fusarium decemcellulare]|nr:hypothetical protein FDECE_820 [Fusarium decemcellulare]
MSDYVLDTLPLEIVLYLFDDLAWGTNAPQSLNGVTITHLGPTDFATKALCQTLEHYRPILYHMRRLVGISRTDGHVVFRMDPLRQWLQLWHMRLPAIRISSTWDPIAAGFGSRALPVYKVWQWVSPSRSMRSFVEEDAAGGAGQEGKGRAMAAAASIYILSIPTH